MNTFCAVCSETEGSRIQKLVVLPGEALASVCGFGWLDPLAVPQASGFPKDSQAEVRGFANGRVVAPELEPDPGGRCWQRRR